jgi:hypothetical protein
VMQRHLHGRLPRGRLDSVPRLEMEEPSAPSVPGDLARTGSYTEITHHLSF